MKKSTEIFGSLLYSALLAMAVLGFVYITYWSVQNFSWIPGAIPLWLPVLLLGLAIILMTYIFSGLELKSIWKNILELSHFELIGFLSGIVLVFASITWAVLPQHIINILPPSYIFFGYFIIASPVLIGMGETLAEGIVELLDRRLSGLVYCVIALTYFLCFNLPVWLYIKKLPAAYYNFALLIFAVALGVQALYVVFMHIEPEIKKKSAERKSSFKRERADES